MEVELIYKTLVGYQFFAPPWCLNIKIWWFSCPWTNKLIILPLAHACGIISASEIIYHTQYMKYDSLGIEYLLSCLKVCWLHNLPGSLEYLKGIVANRTILLHVHLIRDWAKLPSVTRERKGIYGSGDVTLHISWLCAPTLHHFLAHSPHITGGGVWGRDSGS